MRQTRLANLLLLLAALLFLLGGSALVLACGGAGWSDLTAAFLHMAAGRWVVVLALGLVAVGLTVPILVLVKRSVTAAHKHPVKTAEVGRVEVEGEKLVRRARRRLDLEIGRARPQVERVVDALLYAPVDLKAQRLYLEPDEMVVELSLAVGDKRYPVTSMSPPLYEEVLQQLRQMIGATGETGDGVLDLRSSRGSEKILVRLQRRNFGIRTRLQVVTDETEVEQSDGPLKRRRSNSLVFRIEPPPVISDVRTGEIPIPPFEEHDGTDPGSGMLTGIGPSGAHEIAPLVRPTRERNVSGAEAVLRLFLGCVLFIGAGVLFWDAIGWGLARATGSKQAPWRDVTLEVGSLPLGGEVSVDGEVRGRTPLTFTEPCRGRSVAVMVRAKGHTAWQWSGMCPEVGVLRLNARLQPLR